MTDNIKQPDLIREERGEYNLTPEQQAEKGAYRERLRLFLEDPASRQIEGFPIGENDAILALSDPPYYTACPNPFLGEIIEKWEQAQEMLQAQQPGEGQKYHREPFATDVSEGKNDPIYNAHSYHTKVPHKAIMRYILHYTQPGDIVFDGFCGTGMTGVAAQLCGDKKVVESLGYRVTEDGIVFDGEKPFSKMGARKAALVDLSPAATFIAYNYNAPVDTRSFEQEARRILKEVEEECGWMYETAHTDRKTKGKINFMVWSDVFVCPQCGKEMVFWDVAVDQRENKINDIWRCPSCSTQLAKTSIKGTSATRVEHAFETIYDPLLRQTIKRTKQEPVLINYSVGKQHFEKRPDDDDLKLIQKIDDSEIHYFIPVERMPNGDESRRNDDVGITYVHHFYTRRNLYTLATVFSKIKTAQDDLHGWLLFTFEQAIMGMSKWARYVPSHYSQVNQGLSGTLYIGSQIVEVSLDYIVSGKIRRLTQVLKILQYSKNSANCVSTQSSSQTQIPESSVDYVFVDPPFGSNLMYSELNFFQEIWSGVITNIGKEAIVNKTQQKGILEYQLLMEECFHEFYRILKPGRWMTVEFHNSANTVWNSIQEALLRAGYMVADVRTLDKQQGTFKQINSTSAVKQDLIISAYKPNDNLEERFRLQAGSSDGAWAFARYHLGQLPVAVENKGELESVAERQDFLLFDRMVAFHIQRGASVPLSAGEFYAGLRQRFVERDGMFFLPEQVPQYDAARLRLGHVAQLALFVKDEKSAIQWLRQNLDPSLGGEPKTRQDIIPDFQRQLHQANYELLPELDVLLDQNFLQDEEGRWYTPDPSKTTDLEKVRLKSLLREFGSYLEGSVRLRQFRSEAVRIGFGECWKKRDFATIIKVAKRLPESVLHEDPDLLMYYDNATLRAKD